MPRHRLFSFSMIAIIGAILLLLTACTREPTPVPTLIPTAPLPTRDSAPLIVATRAPKCIDSFYYYNREYVFDGQIMQPGSQFLQDWEVMNNGTCDWGGDYLLRFVSGDQMGAPHSIPMPEVRVGKLGKISVQLTAPTEPGTYRSVWKAFNSLNQSFGETLFVEITVPETY